MNKEVITKSIEETQKFAQEFAGKLKPGNIIALYGELGAGKTIFVQGLAKGLGFRGKVFSPTFIFMRPYKISDQTSDIRDQGSKIKILYHIDLYRLEGIMDLKNIGVEEFISEKDAVSAIEWAEKIEHLLPKNVIKIKIERLSEQTRKITYFL